MRNEVENIQSAKSWKENWANLSTYFKRPQAIRCLINTMNTFEVFNQKLRKVIKFKAVFLFDGSLFKCYICL
jgi:transposase-like protein